VAAELGVLRRYAWFVVHEEIISYFRSQISNSVASCQFPSVFAGLKKRSASINARMCAFDAKIGLFLTGLTGLTCCGQRR